ncbi:MAG: hypothetical protein ACK55Z_10325, partial [bacterium]
MTSPESRSKSGQIVARVYLATIRNVTDRDESSQLAGTNKGHHGKQKNSKDSRGASQTAAAGVSRIGVLQV